MGNKQSKQQITKNNKIVNDEKLLKIGVGFGRGDLRVEGNFQMGWHRRCNKKYDKKPLIPTDDTDEEEVINE